MSVVKGYYHDGIIELLEKPENQGSTQILIIFPDTGKKVIKIKGLCKDDNIDMNQIEQNLKELNSKSEKSIGKGLVQR